jgi:hypothetical protein
MKTENHEIDAAGQSPSAGTSPHHSIASFFRLFLVPTPRLTLADDLPAAGTILKVVFLSQALAAVFVLRLDLLAANRTVVDDERVHRLIPPLSKRYGSDVKHARNLTLVRASHSKS